MNIIFYLPYSNPKPKKLTIYLPNTNTITEINKSYKINNKIPI